MWITFAKRFQIPSLTFWINSNSPTWFVQELLIWTATKKCTSSCKPYKQIILCEMPIESNGVSFQIPSLTFLVNSNSPTWFGQEFRTSTKKCASPCKPYKPIVLSEMVIESRGVYRSDWCGWGQIRHQSIAYGLTDLKSVTNPWVWKSDPIWSVNNRIGSD